MQREALLTEGVHNLLIFARVTWAQARIHVPVFTVLSFLLRSSSLVVVQAIEEVVEEHHFVDGGRKGGLSMIM